MAQDKIYIYGDARVVRPGVRARVLDAVDCLISRAIGVILAAITLGIIGGLVGAFVALSGR